jgi:hypothetical protein
MRLHGWLIVLSLTSVATVGCGPKVDLTTGLQVADVTTGWADAGIVDSQNKLVPSISFTLKNVSDKSLVALDLNAKFYRVTEPTIDWDTDMINVAGSEGFAAGASSKHFTIDSKQGYKGTDSRVEMLKNSQFVDAKVAIFAKYSNTSWVRLGDYAVPRQLIAR